MKMLVKMWMALAAAAFVLRGGAGDFPIVDFGARADGSNCTEAIQRAIDACAAAGGGRVVVAGGTYVTGTIILKDDVELHLDASGTLLGSPDWRDWRDQPNSRHVDGRMCPRMRNAALIFAEEARNVAIAGRGTIDANGGKFVESVPDYRGGPRFRRILGPDMSPPRVVLLAGCTDVKLTDVSFRNLPAGWCCWIHDCDRVTVDRVSVITSLDCPNNDGLHVNCSRDVSISNCFIETGDDCIVVRANSASLRENKPCERVTVANCTLRTYANAIRVGWLNDGVIRNCTFSNLVIRRSANGVGIVLPDGNVREKMPDQGREATLVENLLFENVVMDRLNARPVDIRIAPNAAVTRCEGIRNIRFANMTCTGLEFPRILGRTENPIEDVSFSNCSFTKVPDVTAGYENWRNEGYSRILRAAGEPERAHVRRLSFVSCEFSGS